MTHGRSESGRFFDLVPFSGHKAGRLIYFVSLGGREPGRFLDLVPFSGHKAGRLIYFVSSGRSEAGCSLSFINRVVFLLGTAALVARVDIILEQHSCLFVLVLSPIGPVTLIFTRFGIDSGVGLVRGCLVLLIEQTLDIFASVPILIVGGQVHVGGVGLRILLVKESFRILLVLGRCVYRLCFWWFHVCGLAVVGLPQSLLVEFKTCSHGLRIVGAGFLVVEQSFDIAVVTVGELALFCFRGAISVVVEAVLSFFLFLFEFVSVGRQQVGYLLCDIAAYIRTSDQQALHRLVVQVTSFTVGGVILVDLQQHGDILLHEEFLLFLQQGGLGPDDLFFAIAQSSFLIGQALTRTS